MTERSDFESSHVYSGGPRAAAKREGIDFRITAFQARNPDNDPNSDRENGAFRTRLLSDLEAQVKTGAATRCPGSTPRTTTCTTCARSASTRAA